jgi:hypothetical protein
MPEAEPLTEVQVPVEQVRHIKPDPPLLGQG